MRRDEPPIQLLVCGDCQDWQEVQAGAETDHERVGECARFKEMRTAGMRPRCSICWEPRAPMRAEQGAEHADGPARH